jgi:dipeptidyl aminopeptidase/acylaminoacyl peptidase
VWHTADGSWFEPFADWTTSWGAQWSPDGTVLAAFVHRDGGAPTLAIWHVGDQTIRDLKITVGTHFTFERPQWVFDGTALIAETRCSEGAAEGRTVAHGASRPASVQVLRSDDDLEDSRAVPALDASDLTLIGLDGIRRVLVEGWTVRSWRVAPDGRRVGCLRVSRLDTARHELRFDLEIIDLHSAQVTTVAREITQQFGLGWSWSPDGSSIAFLVSGQHSSDELWVVAGDGTGRHRLVDGASGRFAASGAGDSHYQAPRWLDDQTVVWHREGEGFLSVPLGSDSPALVRTPDGDTEQWLIDPDGSAPVVDSSGAFYSVRSAAGEVALDRINPAQGTRQTVARYPGSISPSQLHVGGWPGSGAFLMRTVDQPGELWIADPGGARPVAALNPDLTPVHTACRVNWGYGESALAAGVLVPNGSPPESGWPVVISVYGGNRSSQLVDAYEPENGIIHPSLLTSRGWAVVYPDLPLTDTDPMRQFAPLIRAALDHVSDVVPIDRRRIALVGNSYGSYTVLSLLVTMSQTFCAVAVSAPLINPLASYGALSADGRSFEGLWENGQGRMGCPPWEAPQTWLANTPYLYLDRVDAPVLIGVGGPGLPGEEAQAQQLFAGLRRLGREAELRHYPGEGHAPASWGPEAYSDFAARIVDWITQSPRTDLS